MDRLSEKNRSRSYLSAIIKLVLDRSSLSVEMNLPWSRLWHIADCVTVNMLASGTHDDDGIIMMMMIMIMMTMMMTRTATTMMIDETAKYLAAPVSNRRHRVQGQTSQSPHAIVELLTDIGVFMGSFTCLNSTNECFTVIRIRRKL